MDKHEPIAGLCERCHRAVRPMQASSSQEVKGWRMFDVHGKPRSVVKIIPTGRVLCSSCSTIDHDQGRLF